MLFGGPLGLGLGAWNSHTATLRPRVVSFSLARAVIVGGLAGLVGGQAFGKWMEQVNFFPLVAGLVNSTSRDVGVMLHFFDRRCDWGELWTPLPAGCAGLWIKPGVGHGVRYVWWFVGPLTLLHALQGQPVDWSAARATNLFGSLVGHVIYGLLLGLTYALIDSLRLAFFVESDPINREVVGPASRTLQSLGWGALASVAGGLLFGAIMLSTNSLPRVAGLMGSTSPVIGFLVHLAIAALIGMSFGVLCRSESPNIGAGVAWGLVYGLAWWFLGPLTLLPVLLGGTLAWNIAAASAALPSLIGHLVYGAARADRWRPPLPLYGWSPSCSASFCPGC